MRSATGVTTSGRPTGGSRTGAAAGARRRPRRADPWSPAAAATATANARVTADVATQLGDATLVLRGALARASLELSVVDALSPLGRYAWVVDHLPRLAGSGIVYTLTVADAARPAAAGRAGPG